MKGAASRTEDLPYSWFHYRPIRRPQCKYNKKNEATTIATKKIIPSVMPDLIGHLPTPRGREWGRRADEGVGAPDAVPPLAPTMSLTARGRHGTPQLDAHPSGAPSHQLSPFALAREPDVPATRSILRLLRLRQPHSRPLGVRATT